MKLDIGCGTTKKSGFRGLDRLVLPGVDVVADLERPLPLRDDTVDEIYSKSVLEHVEKLEVVLREFHRVTKRGGRIHIEVPHFSSPLSFSDYTHKRFFGYYTFDYFVPMSEQRSRRKVPDFYTDFKFRIVSKRLRFITPVPPLRPILWLWEALVNSHELAALLYESTFSWIVPCYAIHVELTPAKS